MDSKEEFFKIIFLYYSSIGGDKLPEDLLFGLCERITEHNYNQYKRFRVLYPKSIKRYSSFQIKDLSHPKIFEMIINYIKEKKGKQYPEYAILLLPMNIQELLEFEKNRKEFHDMF